MNIAAVHMVMPSNGVEIVRRCGEISFSGVLGAYPHDEIVPLYNIGLGRLPDELSTMELSQGAQVELVAFNGVILPIIFSAEGLLRVGDILVPSSGLAVPGGDRLRAHGLASVILRKRE